MVVRTTAAPPTPWSKSLAEPQIDESAYVHSFSNLIGDVKVSARVLIAPGTSIRADEGSPFYIGEGTNIQDGVVIHGLEKGRVVGKDGKEYSVWIGNNTCITHLALIHGPAYIGDNCFIGFRSTVFNARIGNGCIVMMHALIQDVEIPPGKYVPSGAVITSQQQADRLPDVEEEDRHFAQEVVEVNEALRTGYQCAADAQCINPIKENLNRSQEEQVNNIGKILVEEDMSLNGEIGQQVRSLLSQGYKIGTEYADKRRFKTSSWLSGPTIEAKRPEHVLDELDLMIKQHPGEYVRLLGIDTKSKKRVLEAVIQRPGEATSVSPSGTAPRSSATVSNRADIVNDVQQLVDSLLSQGYSVGVEAADKRRFKTSSWLTVGTLSPKGYGDAISTLQTMLLEHQGEYVRVIGIDTKSKRRISETIIQRPDDTPGNGTVSNGNGAAKVASSVSNTVSTSNGVGLSAQVKDQVRSLLAQGYKIGTEHADKRRFKTSSWISCSPIDSTREAEVFAALEGCIKDHAGEYVRLIGIDTKAKRRVLETVIQRPGESAVSASSAPAPSTTSSYSAPATSSSNGSSSLEADTLQQVRSLLAQGYKIGTEHADKRRFRTSSWVSCSPIDSPNESAVIAALQSCMRDHQGEYVRLIGIDTKAKRRVLEAVIQRP